MTFDVETLKVSESHKALAAFIKAESGKAPSAATVALVLTLAPEYRKSEAYLAAKTAREAEKAAAEQARRAKKQERLDKVLEQARRLAADLGVELPADKVDIDPATGAANITFASGVEATVPEPVAKAPAKRKTANKAATLVAVPDVADVSPEDAPEDTSAVIVIESADAFEEVTEDAGSDDFLDDDFADDGVEDY